MPIAFGVFALWRYSLAKIGTEHTTMILCFYQDIGDGG